MNWRRYMSSVLDQIVNCFLSRYQKPEKQKIFRGLPIPTVPYLLHQTTTTTFPSYNSRTHQILIFATFRPQKPQSNINTTTIINGRHLLWLNRAILGEFCCWSGTFHSFLIILYILGPRTSQESKFTANLGMSSALGFHFDTNPVHILGGSPVGVPIVGKVGQLQHKATATTTPMDRIPFRKICKVYLIEFT